MAILEGLSSARRQTFCIPAPTLTEDNLPDQSGKVVLITGGYAGVGFELTKILYGKNATIYIAGRSQEKANKAIESLKSACPSSSGRLEFLSIDLQDLTTVKPAVEQFLSKEKRLDFLNNNAGVMTPPEGSKSAQGYDLQIATNCLGPYLFTKLLTPLLKRTAESSSEPNSVRVAWAGSVAIDQNAPKNGIQLDKDGNYKLVNNNMTDYGQSKTGNLFMAHEFGLQNPQIVSVCYNPGNLKTELQRHFNAVASVAVKAILHDAIYGAYTELYCGFSPELTSADNGTYIAPWGRKDHVRSDITLAFKPQDDGGTGISSKFVAWCDKETSQFA